MNVPVWRQSDLPTVTHYNARVRVHSSAPTRLDLAGGTLDIWPLYLFHHGAQTLNAAISLRAECWLTPSVDGAWHIASEDTGAVLRLDDLDQTTAPSQHRLLLRLLHFFRPDPVQIVTRSQSPLGAGLAGSSALSIALCSALARVTDVEYSPESLMNLAMNLEAQVIGVPTGAQDYRPAMYGGIAALELGPSGITRCELPVDPGDLAARVVLAYTGQSRDSGVNNWEITKRHIDGDSEITALFDAIAGVATSMRHALEAGDWSEVGRQMTREWELRKRLAPGVTTSVIDDLVELGLHAGAHAAKVCGAGGGGCLLFLADPGDVSSVGRVLDEAGAKVLEADIDVKGLHLETG